LFTLLLIFIIKDTMKLEEQIKRIKELFSEEHHGGGGDKGRASSSKGGTSTDSSGGFEGDAFEKGGILHNSGRKPDIGKLPKVVDITGGDSEEVTLSVDDIFGIDPANDVIQAIDNLVGAAIPIGPGDPRGGGDGGPGGPGDPHGDDGGPGDPAGGGDDWTGGGHGGDYDDDDYGGDYDDDDPHGPEKPTREPEKQPARGSMDFVPCCEPCGNGMWKRCNTDDCIYSTISDCELRGDNKTYNESTESRTTFND